MRSDSKIFVAGHNGLVGSSIVDQLNTDGFSNLILRDRNSLDLRNESDVISFFEKERPEYVFLAAAKVGGIKANNLFRADFLYENLKIQNNVIWSSFQSGVKKLLFLGSSCIYPKHSQQPIHETELLGGPLEYTNEPYAIAKIAGIKLCESLNVQYGTNFIACMPTNLYGVNDNFDFNTSHVLPAILRKIVLAKWWKEGKWDNIFEDLQNCEDESEAIKEMHNHGVFLNKVILWGTGTPRREFLFNEDLARACVFLMKQADVKDLTNGAREVRNTHINIGYGVDLSVKELAALIAEIVGFEGEILFDHAKPDGTPRKLLDSTKMFNLGWRPSMTLQEGIRKVYYAYVHQRTPQNV